MINLTLFFILLCFSSLAQKTKSKNNHVPTNKDYEILSEEMKCLYKNHLSSTNRLKIYPFNIYKTIVLISFERPRQQKKIFIDSVGRRHIIETKEDFNFNTKKGIQAYYKSITKESKILSTAEINRLTNVLYNYRKKSDKSYNGIKLQEEESLSCYEPRNSILFLDKNGDLAEDIELCFECLRRRISSEKFNIGEFCEGKYSLLQNFFNSVGIKYTKANDESK